MSIKNKFLPVLALAAALSPFAAQARGPVHAQAHQQYLVNVSGAQSADNVHGRAAESNVPAGLALSDSAPQYAAVNNQSVESN